MKFAPTAIPGAYVVEIEPREDERGFFARGWCQKEFRDHGLSPVVAQCNLSFNRWKGTVRGLHYQLAPHAENKLVRCTAGAVFDVAVDLRPESPAFRRWVGVELSASNRRMFYVPEGCAHGYQTLDDGSEVFYQVSDFYHPESERGVRWNDPAFGIAWPLPPSAVSPKDQGYPDFQP